MKTTMKVEGLAELQRGLEQFKKSTQTGVLTRVLKRAAKPVEAAAKANAPVDSGELRDSIATEVVRSNAGKTAYAEAMRSGASRAEAGQAARSANREAAGRGASATVRVKAGAPHGHFTEFGTRTGTPATPFMGPALRQNTSVVTKSIAADLETEITKTARRVATRAAKKGSTK
ncbi:HK97-gp10 family putative phage morphogenesis protein [Ancylobacter sp. VNQ12]|uniref:HK97-gp10 family putative phage morphogenesis protein n=1 Tax=Ancylobacter sp. VNQ12 TaxID=3400920 RepID=UPI003C0C36CC